MFAVEQGLPLTNHAIHGIVQQRDLDWRVIVERGRQLFRRHLEGTVAVNQPHRFSPSWKRSEPTRAPMAAGSP